MQHTAVHGGMQKQLANRGLCESAWVSSPKPTHVPPSIRFEKFEALAAAYYGGHHLTGTAGREQKACREQMDVVNHKPYHGLHSLTMISFWLEPSRDQVMTTRGVRSPLPLLLRKPAEHPHDALKGDADKFLIWRKMIL
jgi:hypothetical protein